MEEDDDFPLKRSRPPVAGPHPAPYPADLGKLEGLDLMARYRAGRRGGNFFDGLTIGERVVFLLTDIAGARAEARALALDVQTAFRRYAPELFGPSGANESEAIATLAYELNRSLIEAARGVHFAPAFLGCFNLALGVLTYHNAGLLAVFHDTEGARTLQSGGMPLGLFSHNTYEPAVLAFEPGARLLLVTKAVIESPGRGSSLAQSASSGCLLTSRRTPRRKSVKPCCSRLMPLGIVLGPASMTCCNTGNISATTT